MEHTHFRMICKLLHSIINSKYKTFVDIQQTQSQSTGTWLSTQNWLSRLTLTRESFLAEIEVAFDRNTFNGRLFKQFKYALLTHFILPWIHGQELSFEHVIHLTSIQLQRKRLWSEGMCPSMHAPCWNIVV